MELIVTEIGMLLAFIVGFIFGKYSKSKPAIGKIKLTKTEQKRKEQEDRANDDLQITLDNINNYNGTGVGQKKYNS
jgi:hypothetical protein